MKSSGSEEYALIGRPYDNLFDQCHVLGDATQIKKMSCGRSHILYETFDGQVYCIGRNDYSQCGLKQQTHGSLIKTCRTHCMYKDEGCDAQPLTNPFKFTTGWFHSTFISSDQKRIYFTGYYSGYSTMGETPDTCFYDFTKQSLSNDIINSCGANYKITDIGSGDHFFAFVVNNEYIVVMDHERFVLHIPDLKEFLVFKSGVAFTRKLDKGNLYLAKQYPNSVEIYDGKYPFNLRSASVADTFACDVRVGGGSGETVVYGMQGESSLSTDTYNAFCISYTYDKKKRQFTDTKKFQRINTELENHPEWDILQFITGSDSIHILLGVRESKEEQLFKKKLHSHLLLQLGSNQAISDLTFNFDR